jgi:hypothetical protein
VERADLGGVRAGVTDAFVIAGAVTGEGVRRGDRGAAPLAVTRTLAAGAARLLPLPTLFALGPHRRGLELGRAPLRNRGTQRGADDRHDAPARGQSWTCERCGRTCQGRDGPSLRFTTPRPREASEVGSWGGRELGTGRSSGDAGPNLLSLVMVDTSRAPCRPYCPSSLCPCACRGPDRDPGCRRGPQRLVARPPGSDYWPRGERGRDDATDGPMKVMEMPSPSPGVAEEGEGIRRLE